MIFNLNKPLKVLLAVTLLYSCNPEECTRIDKIGGGLLPEQEVEVPCDFPEAEPLENAVSDE